MLEIKNLDLKYGQSKILHDISLNAPVGQVTCVTGTSGVGKTSLLKAIAGRHPYSAGSINLDGADVPPGRAAQAAKAGIGYVPQGRENFQPIEVLRHRGQMAIVLVEQNFEFAYATADHFHIMQRGQIKTSVPKSDADRDMILKALSL